MTPMPTRTIALGLLVAMLALAVACALLQAHYPWLAWVRAFAEAGAVGGLADWFAVTALFRHPLGLPIPHTAIIPRNKDAIGVALGEFVEHNFLTPEHVMTRLARQQLAAAAARWLLEPANRERVANGACAAFGWTLQRLGDEDARRFLDRLLTPRLRALEVSQLAGEVLGLLTAQDRHQALLDQALRAVDGWLREHRDWIRQKVREGSWLVPGFVDDYIANRFIDGVLVLLHEAAADPRHALRVGFDTTVRDFTFALKSSPRYRRRGAALMRAVVAHVRRESYYARLWADARARLQSDIAAEDSQLRRHVEQTLLATGEALTRDEAMQQKIDLWLLDALERLLLHHRHQVARLIADVVCSWDAREVSAKIEAQIGRDLQFIRINGTLVGGSAGLALHGMLSWAA